jgi:hypothetical protein
MQNITSAEELKHAIQLLEAEQAFKEQLFKEQLTYTYESFKPINLLRHTLKNIFSSHDPFNTIVGNATGLASGYLSKKIFVRSSGHVIRKLIGTLMQIGVAEVVSRNAFAIKSLGQYIYKYFLRKNGNNSKKRDR